MKVDELRVLEVDELDVKLKSARRELYELRFKHAVGQLENTIQISRVRHDIARIMTVLQERDLGIVALVAPEEAEPAAATPAPTNKSVDKTVDETVHEAVAVATDEAKPKRSRKKTEDKK